MAAVKTLYISSFNWWFMWYFCSLKSTGCMHFIQEASFGRQWWQGGSSLLSYNTQAPMVHAINHVPNSIPKAQSRKKPTYLCAPRAFLKQLHVCRSCLIIMRVIRSFYFDHRINLSPLHELHFVICILHFTNKSTSSVNPITSKLLTWKQTEILGPIF